MSHPGFVKYMPLTDEQNKAIDASIAEFKEAFIQELLKNGIHAEFGPAMPTCLDRDLLLGNDVEPDVVI